MRARVGPASRFALLSVSLLLVATALAGCIGGGSSSTVQDGNTTEEPVEDPEDNETLRNKSPVDVREDTKFSPNSTFHVHDYWGDQDRFTLVDADRAIDWQSRVRDRPLGASSRAPRFTIDVPRGDDRPNLVYPGTGKIAMTLTWSGDDGISPRLCVTNAGQSGNLCSVSQTREFTFGSPGDKKVISREEDSKFLATETVDPPHAIKSNWRFQVWLCQEGYGAQCLAATDVSSFQLSVAILRGNESLPMDPPHFAFYGQRDQLSVLNETTVLSGQTDLNWPVRAYRSLRDEREPIWEAGGFELANWLPSAVPVVPIRTEVLGVEVAWSTGTGSSLEFGYKTAADPWKAGYQVPDSGSSCGEACVRYEIPLPTGEGAVTDSPYAHQTQWRFAIFDASDPPQPMTPTEGGGYEVDLNITAYRTQEALP